MHLTQNWDRPQAGRVVARRRRRGAERRRRARSAPRSWRRAAARSTRWSRPPSRWRCASRGTAVSAASASWSCTRRAASAPKSSISARSRRAELDPAAFPLTGEIATELFTWPQVDGDRNMHGPLSFAIPSAVRGYAAGGRALRAHCRGAISSPRRSRWRGRAAGRLVHDAEGRQRRRRSAPLRREPAGLAAGRSAAGLPARRRRRRRLPLGRLADTLARLAEAGPDDFYEGEIARAIVADIAGRRAACCRPRISPQCRARIVPSLEIPYRGVTFQAARGLTAAPTLADVLDRLSSKRFRQAPDADLFRGARSTRCSRPMHARLEGLGDVEAGSAKPARRTSPRSTATAASRR